MLSSVDLAYTPPAGSPLPSSPPVFPIVDGRLKFTRYPSVDLGLTDLQKQQMIVAARAYEPKPQLVSGGGRHTARARTRALSLTRAYTFAAAATDSLSGASLNACTHAHRRRSP
jgi:hypothetical protein